MRGTSEAEAEEDRYIYRILCYDFLFFSLSLSATAGSAFLSGVRLACVMPKI
jgi:hypothetical protein